MHLLISRVKNVLVTGGASGIGRETSYRFAQTGRWNVASIDKKEFSLDHPNIEEHICDITSDSSVSRLSKEVEDTRLDCLVNNAGISLYGSVEDASISDMKSLYEVNVFGIKRMFDAFSDDLIETEGTIVNISSLQGQFGTAGRGIYSSSKHSVRGISDALRNELRPLGVDVAIIEPGAVDTSLRENYTINEFSRSEYKDLIGTDDEFDSSSVFTVQPVRVADYIIKAAESDDPKSRYRVGWDSKIGAIIERLPSDVRDWFYRIIG